MTILALDPGTLHTGYALLDNGKLFEVGSFRRILGGKRKTLYRDQDLTLEVTAFLTRITGEVDSIVIEAAQRVRGFVQVDPGILVGGERRSYRLVFPLNIFLETAAKNEIKVFLIDPILVYNHFGVASGKELRRELVQRYPQLNPDRDGLSAAGVGVYFLETDIKPGLLDSCES